MKLSEFKKQLKQLEEKLLTEYGLTNEEIYVSMSILDDHGFLSAYVEEMNIEGKKNNDIVLGACV